MKLIKPSFEILTQESSSDGLLKHIERCGRIAYKSEDKITEDSAAKFVQMLIGREHGASLEHGNVYLQNNSYHLFERYYGNKYSIVKFKSDTLSDEKYITTNYRVLIDNNWLDDLQYQCEPTEYHEKRVSVKFTTQIAISREYNRHRVDSITESSTRYCNYSKDKFGNEISINLPHCVTEEKIKLAKKYSSIIAIPNDEYGTLYEKETCNWLDIDWWLWSLSCSELAYMKLIEKGWKAQDARTVLPLATQTEIVHTAFISDWQHFFSLRCAPDAHPDARALAIPLKEEFIKLGYINE